MVRCMVSVSRLGRTHPNKMVFYVRLLGFLVDESKEMITLAGSYDGAKYYQQMMSIPKANIKSKKLIK